MTLGCTDWDSPTICACASQYGFVLPGDGQFDVGGAVAVLSRNGYDGWLMFEHEKRWHPELESPDVAFPAYATWARRVLAGQLTGQ